MFLFSFFVVASICLRTIYSQSITMSGGSYSYQGRIEIWWYTSGCWLFCEDRWEWGTVCDDFFDMNDANVACRSMGYVGAVSVHGSAYFGQGGGPVWLDDVNCGGWESYLWHCSTPGWGNVNCGHGEDVGVTCDINHCSYYAPCQNGAACTDLVGTYSCQCVAGYTGGNCEINIDDCVSNYCVHGSCVDGITTYTCSCYAGYTATYCDENIDECSSAPCNNGAPCIDGVNGYTCSCLAGYSGTHCETNIDECSSSPCQNGAECSDRVNRYICICVAGYDGAHCETDIDECASSPCQNGATCVDDVNQYTCTCVQGNEGTHCEIDTDECASGPCLNGGTCIDQFNGYVCTCVPWYYEYNCVSLDTSYSESTLTRYTGNALIDKAYQILKVRSQIECMRTCLGSSGCQSGNFITSSGACEISGETKADHASDFISISGTVYFEKP